MSGNLLTVTLFSYLKEMTSGCKTFLLVFSVISQMSKFTFTEPIHAIISICIIKSIRRSTQGSSIRIDRLVFGSTLNSNKLDEKVKILVK